MADTIETTGATEPTEAGSLDLAALVAKIERATVEMQQVAQTLGAAPLGYGLEPVMQRLDRHLHNLERAIGQAHLHVWRLRQFDPDHPPRTLEQIREALAGVEIAEDDLWDGRITTRAELKDRGELPR